MRFRGKFPLQSISHERFSYRLSARILPTGFFYSYVGIHNMVFIQFTASGSNFAVQEFLSEHLVNSASSWQRGDARRFGKVHEDSGFGLSLPDAETTVAAIPLVEAFLKDNVRILSALQHLGTACNLHLGVTVGERSSFAPTIEFAPALLHHLARCNISLSVTGYPTSDEDEAQPSVPLDVPAAISRRQGRE